MPRTDVVSLSAGCLPSLLSVSRGEDIVSGLTFGGDSPNRRSSTPQHGLEPPLASVERTVYTPEREGLHAKPLRDG